MAETPDTHPMSADEAYRAIGKLTVEFSALDVCIEFLLGFPCLQGETKLAKSLLKGKTIGGRLAVLRTFVGASMKLGEAKKAALVAWIASVDRIDLRLGDGAPKTLIAQRNDIIHSFKNEVEIDVFMKGFVDHPGPDNRIHAVRELQASGEPITTADIDAVTKRTMEITLDAHKILVTDQSYQRWAAASVADKAEAAEQ
jgi:hypothetical protein